jgi:hypothetical protein
MILNALVERAEARSQSDIKVRGSGGISTTPLTSTARLSISR